MIKMKVHVISLLVLFVLFSCKEEETLRLISLNESDTTLLIGEELQLTVTTTPSSIPVPTIVWTSSNSSIAIVDSEGWVTAKSVGVAKITATTEDFAFQSICNISVLPIIATGIKLNTDYLELFIGEVDTLTYNIMPPNATDPKINWFSLDSLIAFIDQDGIVKANALGSTTIFIKTGNSFSDSCNILVKPIPISSIELSEKSITIEVNESAILVVTIIPENATNKNIFWSSSNNSIATVNNGAIQGNGVGNAVITAKSESGDFIALCDVIVNPISVKSVIFDIINLNLIPAEKALLIATVLPTNAFNKTLKWESSNEGVAIVDNSGNVTAKNIGSAIITAKSEAGNFSASCNVNVGNILNFVTLIAHPSLVSIGSTKSTFNLMSRMTNTTNNTLFINSVMLLDGNNYILQITSPDGSRYNTNSTTRTYFSPISFNTGWNGSIAILSNYSVLVQFNLNGIDYNISTKINTSIVGNY